jgi:hypothetical protein
MRNHLQDLGLISRLQEQPDAVQVLLSLHPDLMYHQIQYLHLHLQIGIQPAQLQIDASNVAPQISHPSALLNLQMLLQTVLRYLEFTPADVASFSMENLHPSLPTLFRLLGLEAPHDLRVETFRHQDLPASNCVMPL